jgi:hypothetical protein
MQTSDKVRTGLYLSPKVDERLRVLAARHRKSNSEIVEAMIIDCVSNPHFINKLTKKEEIDYPI